MTTTARAALLLVVSNLLFAASYTLTKVALVDLGPFTLGFIRFALATGIIAAWLVVRGRLERPSRHVVQRLALAGLFGVTGYFALENLGVSWARASDATMLSAAFPAIMAVTDVLVAKVRIGWQGWVGIALAVLGSLPIVLGAPDDAASGPKRLLGCLLILAAGVTWAAYTIVTRTVAGQCSSWTTVLWQDGVGAVGFLPLALVEAPGWHLPTQSWATTGSVLALTVLCSVLAMVFYADAVRHLPSALVAASINLVPLFGLVIALLVLHEGVGWWQVVGCVVVAAGVLVSRRS